MGAVLWSSRGVPIMRVRGIPVEAHWSLVIVVLSWAGALASSGYLGRYPGASTTTITAMALVSVLLLFASILLHELGHALQSQREGVGVERITLWFFGGVAWASAPARTLGAWFRVVVAGPLVTLLLAGLFGALSWLGGRLGWPDAVVGVTILLAQINVFVLVFNLVPVLPLDGGQMLHAAVQRFRGPAAAAVWMPRVGFGLASLLIGFGIVAPFVGVWPPAQFPPSLVLDASPMLEGLALLWLTLAFRPVAGTTRRRHRGLVVADLLAPPGADVSVESHATIAQFLEAETGPYDGHGTRASPVLEAGRPVGVISHGLAMQVTADQRAQVTVAEVMLRREDAVVLHWQTPIDEAFDALQGAPGRGVVLDGKRVTAIILASNLADVLLRVKDAERGLEPAAACRPELTS
jgi:Zn-dependent protease